MAGSAGVRVCKKCITGMPKICGQNLCKWLSAVYPQMPDTPLTSHQYFYCLSTRCAWAHLDGALD